VTLTLSDTVKAGKAAYGATLTIADPFLGEVIAAQPFDFLLVDMEHSPISHYQLQTQLIALRSSAATILVRVPHNDPTTIMQVLDLGAQGVVVPQVETGEQCAIAVGAAYYPPAGTRGVGPRRAARLGDRASYFARATAETFVAVMIESRAGIDNIDDILATEHLGGVIVGVADLSASLGQLNNSEHRDVVNAIDLIVERCVAADVPFGMYAPSAAAASDLVSRGARIITVGSDLLFFEQGMRAVVNSVVPAKTSS
jgi:4-hydroxy-2-oxoheptanedioate aldolase